MRLLYSRVWKLCLLQSRSVQMDNYMGTPLPAFSCLTYRSCSTDTNFKWIVTKPCLVITPTSCCRVSVVTFLSVLWSLEWIDWILSDLLSFHLSSSCLSHWHTVFNSSTKCSGLVIFPPIHLLPLWYLHYINMQIKPNETLPYSAENSQFWSWRLAALFFNRLL
jgi:hypothetical protein